MTQPPNPPPSRGWVVELIASTLAYIDKPWKAIVVVVLILTGGFGWALYEKRDEIFELWLTPANPELNTVEVPHALEKLTTETDADIVQIWAVDLSSNSQWYLGARRHDGERPVVPTPRRLPIIAHVSDVEALIDVMEGHHTCVDLSTAGTPLARRLADRGMKRGCAIPILPNPTELVGVIYLAWSIPTDESNENVAVGAAREIARKLSTH